LLKKNSKILNEGPESEEIDFGAVEEPNLYSPQAERKQVELEHLITFQREQKPYKKSGKARGGIRHYQIHRRNHTRKNGFRLVDNWGVSPGQFRSVDRKLQR
jgi:hypothetical protein